ncbi:hypothetical protein GCM10009760_53470 [Kitasatospora kazusensis]|uniref:Uncharacterized protein n=1 Tax=Kitasatospora kazusensis TaxID=407974 RepID=A0ABN3A6F6_9ACTN
MGRRRQGALPGQPPQRRLTSIAGGRETGGGVDEPSDTVRELKPAGVVDEAEQPRLWHVVLSVAGKAAPLAELRAGLEQLAHDHSFFLTARYAADHAEIRYWEQARDLHDAAAIALRLWGEHKLTANLPPWEIVGLEVVDRPTYHKRVAEGFGDPPRNLGGVQPY